MRRVGVLLLLCVARPASAGPNDLNLAGLVLRSSTPTFDRTIHGTLFKQLTTELGVAMAPQFTDPSSTVGLSGFEIGFSTAVTNIHQDADYWQFARRTDERADGALAMTSLHVRKGLPASFELGGNVSWISNSEMFALGLEVKWALNEGFYYIPDVAIRGTVNVLVGARDLQVDGAADGDGFDLSLSKSFPIGGTTTLTPYAGYNLLIINANSHVLDPTPTNPLDIENNFVFSPQTTLAHRLFFGLRLKTYFVALVAGTELSFADLVPWMQTYLAKLSFEF